MQLPPPMKHAIKISRQSSMAHKLGAVLVSKKKMIGRGYNQKRGSGFSSYYQYSNVFHAEAAAINYNKGSRCDTIYVARVNRYGRLLLAKPCLSCCNLLKKYGIKWVVFTTNGGIQKVKLDDLIKERREDSGCSISGDEEDIPNL